MIAALLTVVRRSPVNRLLPLLAVPGLWTVLYSSDSLWIGRWYDTALYLEAFAGIVVGPVLAVSAASLSAQNRREPGLTLERSFPRRRLDALIVVWTSHLVFAFAVLLVVAVAAGLRTVMAGAVGGPSWSILALAASVVALEVAFGVLVGAILPGLAAAGVTVVGLYGFYFWHARGEIQAGARRFFPVLQEHWDPMFVPRDPRIVVACGWCLALAALLLMASASLHGFGRPPLVALLVIASAAVACGGLLGSWQTSPGAGLFSAVRPADDVVCRSVGRGGQICVWNRDKAQFPALVDGYQAVEVAAGALPGFPTALVEPGIRPSPSPGVMEFLFVQGGPTAADVKAAILNTMTPDIPPDCPAVSNAPALQGHPWREFFLSVLSARVGVPSGADSAEMAPLVHRFSSQSRKSQDVWLRQAFLAASQCHVVPPLP
jgi:hypothetical protein